ncbi:hypothetical protein CSAL01_01881 [Colletotrichum salicis]|uniref:Uncharacterized protein n=1 Tax=Colletotrichum salicis TaxID=1209931 RepID=A0A135V9V9_9PEZI|nr:hypothetical protein CSAL01_01881 [Colletotrichum salicis]
MPPSISDWNFLTNAVKLRLPWFTFTSFNEPIWENSNMTAHKIVYRGYDIQRALQNLVFSHLPNLSTLHFAVRVLEGRPLSGYEAYLAQTESCCDFDWYTQEHLHQVENFFIYGEDTQLPFRFYDMELYKLCLPPTLTHLSARNCELVLRDNEGSMGDGSFFPPTWSTKKISLVNCTMTSDVLSQLTYDVIPLEEFEYVVDSKIEDKTNLVTAAETISRLKSYSAFLVDLRLRFRLSDGKPIRDDEESYKPSDFCDFKNLKTLVVHLVDFGFHDNPGATVPGVSTMDFPKSIENITVHEIA